MTFLFEDGLFEWAVEYLGGDRLVLATDSPHWDSSRPGRVTGPVAKSTTISQENKKKSWARTRSSFWTWGSSCELVSSKLRSLAHKKKETLMRAGDTDRQHRMEGDSRDSYFE